MFDSSRDHHRRCSLGDLHVGYNSETDGGEGVVMLVVKFLVIVN